LLGLGLAATLFIAIFLWLRNSSRGHRLIVESAIGLILGFPVAGIQVVSDLNRELDHGEPQIVRRQIINKGSQAHRGKGGGYTTYHLRLAPPAKPEEPMIPDWLQVNQKLYNGATPQSSLRVEVAPGWLGVRWYRRMSIEQ
jgi:hypothetical protein